jgi:hypothetical protein
MKKFNKNELFCKKCFTHDTFFIGGGATAPDSCPGCGGTTCIPYMNLSFLQKSKTRDKFDIMWKEKWNL